MVYRFGASSFLILPELDLLIFWQYHHAHPLLALFRKRMWVVFVFIIEDTCHQGDTYRHVYIHTYTCISCTQTITWILSFINLKISAAGGRSYLSSRFIDRYYFVLSSNNLNICYRGG